MIRFRLRCRNDHEFEAWFRSGADYDDQVERRILACPECGSKSVEKALMAPSLSKGTAAPKLEPSGAGRSDAQMMAGPLPSPVSQNMGRFLEVVRTIRRQVTENADYVGKKFAEEARKIHYEEIEPRGIYGEASAQEASELREEGIEVHPLPMLPEDNN